MLELWSAASPNVYKVLIAPKKSNAYSRSRYGTEVMRLYYVVEYRLAESK